MGTRHLGLGDTVFQSRTNDGKAFQGLRSGCVATTDGRTQCRLNRKEAQPRLDQSFDEAMILLDQVIEVFDLPHFDRLGKHSGTFEFSNRFGIGRILIDSDHTRG